MAVDANIVRQMADLARLKVPDDRIDDLATEMNAILEFMSAIKAWEGSTVVEQPPAVRRADVVFIENKCDLMDAAGDRDGNSVVVPPVKGAS